MSDAVLVTDVGMAPPEGMVPLAHTMSNERARAIDIVIRNGRAYKQKGNYVTLNVFITNERDAKLLRNELGGNYYTTASGYTWMLGALRLQKRLWHDCGHLAQNGTRVRLKALIERIEQDAN